MEKTWDGQICYTEREIGARLQEVNSNNMKIKTAKHGPMEMDQT
jgi:hypothetical protein